MYQEVLDMALYEPNHVPLPKHLSSAQAYPLTEEVANVITHGVATLLAVAGTAVLLTLGMVHGNPAKELLAYGVFGAAMVTVFLMSTVFHSVFHEPAREFLLRLDHCAILLMFGGTYTPVILLNADNKWGITMLTVIWSAVVVGIWFNLVAREKFRRLQTAVYGSLTWCALLLIPHLWANLSPLVFFTFAAGLVCYNIGFIFFIWHKLPFHHAIWHVFTGIGALCHYAAVFGYIFE